ncbi:winged helix-turn-helix domain-containing protein [Tunturibacter empetritectus]|uniref:DNA-binding winged helix-turn-helix (WHTH) protein/tetratricopeptide (TPR) repeat protein n=2 Tax=Tunturiibacter empetritectus TaxID=3069691 RepID=A0A7W8IK51_9BACT|nr:winged helix-turn-helix domain-containing protein [Edaphobacter lichenicola]MBB5318573.1 DNA-binding winged helix-turn-helix (wHTH) protein/tetratricopeptide (TPR) repeat protein [Edaphobacter lichenicola]
MQTHPEIVYQFGPFEVNVASGELLKNGRRIKLQEQPYRLLVALLENPGKVISREELRSRLWLDDTFVDFDGSLRVAVRKLREALDDDAEDPRYIETIPKRGYRFLVPEVRRIESAPEAAEPEAATFGDHARRDDLEPLKTGAKATRWWLVAGAAILMIGIGLTVGSRMFFPHKVHALTDKDTIVLADFANATGDPVFDGTLRQGLSVQLEQSPFLSIIPDEKIQQTLGLMGQPVDVKLVPAVAREVCQRTASAVVLDGSIAKIGTQYLLTLKAVNCKSGETLASSEAQASDENHVLNALGKVSVQIRNKLGESLSTIRKFDTPLEEATTPSLEALKAYSSAMQTVRTKGPDAATPFFKRAVELDPNFAVAYAYLGVMATTSLEPSLSVDYRTKAYELRGRVSEAEKYWITATYHKGVSGNIPKAIEACDLWIQAYPRSEMPRIYLGAAVLPVVGQYERAVEESSEAVRLRPDFPLAYAFNIRAHAALNRFDEAKALYAKALERRLSNPFIDVAMYDLAFAQNDTAGMAQHAAKLKALPRLGHQIINMEGDTAAYSGHLIDARELSRRAMDNAQRAGEKDAPAVYSGTSGLREAWFGNTGEARRRGSLALKLSSGRDLQYFVALTFAYARDDARAKALADDLDKRFPEDTIVQFNYLPTVRGKLALNKGDVSGAIQSLGAAAPYELGATRTTDLDWTAMFPVFVRGEAYLAARQGSQAAAEFQKILDHRGLVLNQPIGALAHLGLGRAYVLQSDIPKAKAAYLDFLTLWQDADPDIPVLQQAKAEYAKLQ